MNAIFCSTVYEERKLKLALWKDGGKLVKHEVKKSKNFYQRLNRLATRSAYL